MGTLRASHACLTTFCAHRALGFRLSNKTDIQYSSIRYSGSVELAICAKASGEAS